VFGPVRTGSVIKSLYVAEYDVVLITNSKNSETITVSVFILLSLFSPHTFVRACFDLFVVEFFLPELPVAVILVFVFILLLF
jgi:hypothetical protein